MLKNTYACTNCKQTFTRKFNAERHNNKVHDGIAVIYNKENGWKSDKETLRTLVLNYPYVKKNFNLKK